MFMQDLVTVNTEMTPKVLPKVCIGKPRCVNNFLNCHEQLHSWETFVLVGSELVSPLYIQQHIPDAKSMSNLRKHAKSCWGAETVEAADQTKDVTEAQDSVVKPLGKDGSITAIFERVGKERLLTHTDNIQKLRPSM
jgi:hypothetical protein